MFNRALKQALDESKSTSPQQPAEVSISSQGETASGDPDSESEGASDFLPDQVSSSDEDFEPSPTPAKVARKPPRENKKADVLSKAAPKKRQSKKETTAPPKKPVVRPAVPVHALDSSNLPGSTSVTPGRTSGLGPRAAMADGTNKPKVVKKNIGGTKWVPPSRVDTKNTPQGRTAAPAIRVGLSRKAPIKPLHQTPLKTKN